MRHHTARAGRRIRRVSTSISDPLRVDAVETLPGHGRIGITLCPGKRDKFGGSKIWDRDVVTDVAALRTWGAAAVVTLIEDHEFVILKVEELPAVVNAAGMAWLHLPIRDVSIPTHGWQVAWGYHREYLLDLLAAGYDVVVHCRGGRGRAGMVAAELLMEHGIAPPTALARVRDARPGAVETARQEQWVLQY